MALKEPIPDEEKTRNPPHYLRIPGQTTYCVKRTLIDPKGALDGNKRVTAEVDYTFFQGRATPVGNTDHAEKLLEILAKSGVEELAYVEAEEKVEEFHPQFTRGEFKGEFDESRVVKVVTRRFKPTSVVVRTGRDFLASGIKGAKPVHVDDAGGVAVSSFDDLKVSELQDLCRQKGLSVSGNKAELILRLESHEEEEN